MELRTVEYANCISSLLMRFLNMTMWWWSSSQGALGNVVFPFITITSRSIMVILFAIGLVDQVKKRVLDASCLTLSIISYRSRIKGVIDGKESNPLLHFGVVVIEKRALGYPWLRSANLLTSSPGLPVPVRDPVMGQIEIFNHFLYLKPFKCLPENEIGLFTENFINKLFLYRLFVFNICMYK